MKTFKKLYKTNKKAKQNPLQNQQKPFKTTKKNNNNQ